MSVLVCVVVIGAFALGRAPLGVVRLNAADAHATRVSVVEQDHLAVRGPHTTQGSEGLVRARTAHAPVVRHHLERFMVGESLGDSEPVGLIQQDTEEVSVDAWAEVSETTDRRFVNGAMWDSSLPDAFAMGGLTLSGVGEGSAGTQLSVATSAPGVPATDTPKARIVQAAE